MEQEVKLVITEGLDGVDQMNDRPRGIPQAIGDPPGSWSDTDKDISAPEFKYVLENVRAGLLGYPHDMADNLTLLDPPPELLKKGCLRNTPLVISEPLGSGIEMESNFPLLTKEKVTAINQASCQDSDPEPAGVLLFEFKNYRGETSTRHVAVHSVSMYVGQTEHHPEPQVFLKAYDYDRGGIRHYPVKDIIKFY